MRISGVPCRIEENLVDIFAKVAYVIQFDLSNPVMFPYLLRINLIDSSTGAMAKNGTIIGQFVAPHIKTLFYSRYLQNLKLNLNDMGFNTKTRVIIIISENLTKSNKLLFDEAYKLKKQNKLHQVFTSNYFSLLIELIFSFIIIFNLS